jgi:hypothetical protein
MASRAARRTAKAVEPPPTPAHAHAKDPPRMRNTERISTHCVIAASLDIAFYAGYDVRWGETRDKAPRRLAAPCPPPTRSRSVEAPSRPVAAER